MTKRPLLGANPLFLMFQRAVETLLKVVSLGISTTRALCCSFDPRLTRGACQKVSLGEPTPPYEPHTARVPQDQIVQRPRSRMANTTASRRSSLMTRSGCLTGQFLNCQFEYFRMYGLAISRFRMETLLETCSLPSHTSKWGKSDYFGAPSWRCPFWATNEVSSAALADASRTLNRAHRPLNFPCVLFGT